jgi:hypothetical protein
MLLRTHYRILIEGPIALNSPYFGGGGNFQYFSIFNFFDWPDFYNKLRAKYIFRDSSYLYNWHF